MAPNSTTKKNSNLTGEVEGSDEVMEGDNEYDEDKNAGSGSEDKYVCVSADWDYGSSSDYNRKSFSKLRQKYKMHVISKKLQRVIMSLKMEWREIIGQKATVWIFHRKNMFNLFPLIL